VYDVTPLTVFEVNVDPIVFGSNAPIRNVLNTKSGLSVSPSTNTCSSVTDTSHTQTSSMESLQLAIVLHLEVTDFASAALDQSTRK
jgi:hypothetical protein